MRKLLVLLAALSLAGCATGANNVPMTLIASATPQVSATSPYRNAIVVGSITGGKITLPFWMSEVGNSEFGTALKNSIGNAGLLATDAGKYRLDVQLVDIDQPLVALDITVSSTVHYTLTDIATGRTAFDQTIKADYTAKVVDQPLAFIRLKRANEGSMRHNIEQFLQQLLASP